MSLQALTNKASVLVGRQTSLTPSLLKEIDALKRQAALEGVATQFDTALRVLFKDKFDKQSTPPPPTEKAGNAHNLASGGVRGAALQFFTGKDAIKDPAALGAMVAKRVPELRTTTALPVPLEQQFPPLKLEQQRAANSELRADARSVISAETAPLYEAGQRRTNAAIDRVMRELERWVALQPKKDVPLTKDGKVPYLTGALDYGDGRQLAFAARLRDQAVTLLRQQESLP